MHCGRLEGDSPISPGTVDSSASNYFAMAPEVPPKDRGTKAAGSNNHRKEIAAVDRPAGLVPSISRDPPSAPLAQVAPWADDSPSAMPSTALLPPVRNFFDDNESLQVSPSFRPGTARTDTSDSADVWPDQRRPSVASASTIGSQDSGRKTSASKGSYHKKLAGFFGEDIGGGRSSSQPTADTTVPNSSTHSLRTRNHIAHAYSGDARPLSPASRPRTPLPSSDVAPWVFQDIKVRSRLMVAVSPRPARWVGCTRLAIEGGH